MPSCSISRLTNANAVSRYCTQYSHVRYSPLSDSSKSVNPMSRNTCLMMSGADISWKIRQSLVRVKNHSHGTTLSEYAASPSSVARCENSATRPLKYRVFPS